MREEATILAEQRVPPKRRSFRQQLAIRQALLVVLIACLLGLLAASVQIYVDYTRQLDNIEALSAKQLASIEEAATNALVELNEGLATAITKGLLGHEMFMAAKLETPSDYVLAEHSRARMTSIKARISHYLFGEPQQRIVNLTYNDGANKMNVGRLEVVIDTCSVGAQFLDRALVTLISAFLKSLALAIAMLIIFYVTLTKPLTSLAAQINNVDLRDRPDARVSLPDNIAIDELETIAHATNTHLDLIEKHVRAIDAARSELHETNQDLERRIEDRTIGLRNEIQERVKAENRLRRALEAAEQNASAKTLFLANMSHELRTPLNAIIGYSEFLTLNPEKVDDLTREEYLAHIRDSGHHLLTLVNNILDLSRLSEGQMPVNLEMVDINGLIRDTAAYMDPLVTQNSNTLVLDLDTDAELTETDETRLKQVLINLIGNAAKFTKNGTITIKSFHTDEDNGSITLSVEDTGIGIPADDIANIFDNFTQADSRMNRNFEGSGLGLSIVRETCDLLGWKVNVESTLGEGSRFTIRIPRAS